VKKEYQKRVVLSLIALVFGVSFIGSGSVHAADTSESITLSPVSKRYAIDAGSMVTDKLTVINDGKTAYDFIVYARPYSVNGESYDPNFTSTPSNADAYQWVQFNKTSYHLAAGESTEIEYTMRVPAQAAPGGHYGVLFAETQPSQENVSGNAVVRKKRVGSIVYATVKGSYINKGESLSTSIPFLQNRAPLSATTVIKNEGNTDFLDTIHYTVKDLFGNVKYDVSKDYPVLPKTTRKVQVDWQNAAWFGLYKVHVDQSFLDKKISQESFVLMIPRWLLVVIGLGVVGAAVYVILRRRR
jgi:hypothetical protein